MLKYFYFIIIKHYIIQLVKFPLTYCRFREQSFEIFEKSEFEFESVEGFQSWNAF